MQLVIELDEWVFNRIAWDNSIDHDTNWRVTNAILNSTPLPEHHGRLIDAEKIANDINALKDNWNRYGNEYESGRYESYDYAVDTIEDAPTIIEGSEPE